MVSVETPVSGPGLDCPGPCGRSFEEAWPIGGAQLGATVSSRGLDALGSIASIATSSAPALDRIDSVLSALRPIMPHAAAHVAAVEYGRVETLLHDGYPDEVLSRFNSPDWMSEAQSLRSPPELGAESVFRQQDLPDDGNITVNEYLRPAGFQEGVTHFMTDRQGRLRAVLNLSCEKRDEASPEAREVVRLMGGALGNLVQQASLSSDHESVFVVSSNGALLHRCGLRQIGAYDGMTLVEQHLDRGVGFAPSLVAVAATGDGTISHEMQIVPLTSFEGMATRAAIVVREARASLLSPREVEVLRLVAAGRSNVEIAEELSIARRTVASHIEHILVRLGVGNRTAAAVLAAQSGLLSSSPRSLH